MNETVQQIDLGVRVFGVDQCEYAFNGVRDKTLGQAMGLAGLFRAVAIEQGINGYTALLNRRLKKLDDLKEALAVIAGTRAGWDAITGTEDAYYTSTPIGFNFTDKIHDASAFADILAQYGITTGGWDGSGQIIPADLDIIKSDVEYRIEREDNDMQCDMTTLQNYVSKRDSAYSSAEKFQKKCDDSISSQMKYILG